MIFGLFAGGSGNGNHKDHPSKRHWINNIQNNPGLVTRSCIILDAKHN
jgi:hypothetical protein